MRISDWSSDVGSSYLRFNKSQTSLLVRGFPAGPILQASGSFRATTWNVSALYKIDPDVSLYATVRRGYRAGGFNPRSEEHTSELQSLMRISYAVFCLKKKKHSNQQPNTKTKYRTNNR